MAINSINIAININGNLDIINGNLVAGNNNLGHFNGNFGAMKNTANCC